MIKYEYKTVKGYTEKKFIENGHTMFESDVLQRLERLAFLEENNNSKMYKITFEFKKGNPRGGVPYWTSEIVLIGANSEIELNKKINGHISNDHSGYHKFKKLIDINIV